MRKYIIGFVLGSVLFSSGVAFAKVITNEVKWYVVSNIQSGLFNYEKTYDEDTQVVCYSIQARKAWDTGSISCLKNN